MANYPASLDAISNPTGATNQNDAGFLHSVQHGTANDILEQLEARVGIAEATPQNTPLANTVLQSLADGRSKWATIITAMLAANAVSQVGIGIGTGGTNINTTFVDIPGCSVPLTTTGGDLIAILLGTFSNHTAAQVTYQALRLDSGADQNVSSQHAPQVDYNFLGGTVALFTGVSAAPHTVYGRWRVLGGTGAVAAAGQPVLLVIERKR